MAIQQGPRKNDKIPLGCKVANFEVNDSQSTLLIASAQHKLQSYYLKDSVQQNIKSKVLPMVSLDINCVPSLFSFSGKNSIIHCDNDLLLLNNKKELQHANKINHLLVDEYQIALTTCMDSILISSTQKAEFQGKLHYYGGNITSIFWNNSLVISGDSSGNINLWDINREKVIHNNCLYRSSVDFVSSYVDFIHTNLYYTMARQENKIAFHDLRTFRPIKITSIKKDVRKAIHNSSGKIFLMSAKQIEIIDVYQGYNVLGSFSELQGAHLNEFMLKHPQALSQSRLISDLISWNQFIIAGCDNGCIQVYNSDTLQCEYAYGVCENSGIVKLRHIQNSLIALEEKGMLSLASFA